MTRTPPGGETDDTRFTAGLLYDVQQVLERHGYRLPADQNARRHARGTAMGHLLRLVRAFEGIASERRL